MLARASHGRRRHEFRCMTAEPPTSRFDCANCGAQYALVRVEGESAEADSQIACCSCGSALNGYEGRFILKYFLVDRPRVERSRVDLPKVDLPRDDHPRVDRPNTRRSTEARRSPETKSSEFSAAGSIARLPAVGL
jgi:DNA-directed RNA polymerase subunit RPC12/RpoP